MEQSLDRQGRMRNLPLALQWAYTDGACALFASVALRLASCKDGVARILEDDDDGYHVAIRLADGRYLDAEGVRDRDDIIACFGLQRSTLREIDWQDDGSISEHAERLLGLLTLHGWNDGLPIRLDGPSASSSPKRASGAFERLGGMSSSPVAVIDRFMKAAA